MPKVIAVMGPTASGKTDLAIAIAQHFSVDLISVDSALVYRDMNIGTAKPDAETLAKYPHALIDILSPEASYSAANFAEDARRCIQQAIAQQRVPVLVGGTMLYYRALLNGLDNLPPSDEAIRQQLNNRLLEVGSAVLHEQLRKLDAASAERIHPNDPQRILRALEVYEITGKPLSNFQTGKIPEQNYNCLKLVLLPEQRRWLHSRIEKRFTAMLEMGFIDEVKKLQQAYQLHVDLPSMRAVGYRQVWQYLQGEFDHKTMIEKGIIATRQLAKRQHTWLRKESNMHVFNIEKDYHSEALTEVAAFLKSEKMSN